MSISSAYPPLTSAWAALDEELDRWAEIGETAYFWWRDDDAADVTPALDQLLALQRSSGVPLALAVIPGQATRRLAHYIGGPEIVAAQHGFVHENHATNGEKKSEFPINRSLLARIADLRRGVAIMADLFPEQRRCILVPPWNRLSTDLLEHLPDLGFTAISGFKMRRQYWAAKGLVWLNTHIDPVAWRSGDSTAGCISALAAGCEALCHMRSGGSQQPIGLLTHHLRHDAAGWDFIARFLTRIQTHPAACWTSLDVALQIGRPLDVIPAS